MRRAAEARRSVREDSGVSLVELMVAMTLLVAVGGMLAAAVQQGGAAVVKVQNVSIADDQARIGFARLDRDVRSAYALNRPARVGTDWYLELQTSADAAACVQWRVLAAAGALQTRTWRMSGSSVSGLTPWAAVATGVVNDPLTQPPFSFQAADDTDLRQAVTLRLSTRAGSGARSGTSETVTRLVARNTSVMTATNADRDGNGVSDTEVCRQVGRS